MSDSISKFLRERIDAGDFPSAVYLVAERGEIKLLEALGSAVVEPEKIDARTDTIYDLASLTKPLVTGLLLAHQIEIGNAKLDDDLAKLLPRFVPSGKGSITIGQLATHTSGFTSWLPLYLVTRSAAGVEEAIAAHAPAKQTGSEVIYSDLNFIALAFAIERMYGSPLDTVADDIIFRQLELNSTRFRPSVAFPLERIAASEKGNQHEKNTCIELGYLQPEELPTPHPAFRTQQIWGEVHDGNAFFMGGAAGHAGLFSTAEEVFKIALQFLPNYATLLKPETTELFRTNLTIGMNEARSVAFQLAETPQSTAGSRMSPESFGHLGFTGTSMWIDPVKDRIFILLTNRTHAHSLPFVNINSVRRRLHDLANELLDR